MAHVRQHPNPGLLVPDTFGPEARANSESQSPFADLNP